MSVFLIAEIKVTNESWIPAYAANVHEIVARHGGRYISRSGNITSLEGPAKDCALVAIIEFPSRTALEGFVNSPEYQPYAQARRAGSVSQFVMVDDTDVAGTIPYLKAA